MARGWKRLAEVVLVRSGLAARAERLRCPSTLILAYHNVVPRGEEPVGDASLHVDQDVFADQLDFILEGRRVVALCDIETHAGNDPSEARVVITFDDAYVGALSAGVEELAKRGLPATVFVPPGLLGSEGMWWDRLAPRGGGALKDEIRAYALGELQGKTEAIIAWARDRGLPLQTPPEHARPIHSDELRGRGTLPVGITLGPHTWSHPNLAALGSEEVEEELTKSRAWLKDHSDRYVDWLAYPYGLRNATVTEAAATLFEGALLISGGGAERGGRKPFPLHETPRVNVPRGLSLEGLALRLGGLA
jgi:peptidoglycan/xylan/chitin deacetylase (PgdA/CDA1 family)